MDNLELFILNSNAIEGYMGAAYQPGSIHYDQHLDAYWYLYKHGLSEKNILIAHSILMKDLLERSRGMYRLRNVHHNSSIDGKRHQYPEPIKVPGLMQSWLLDSQDVLTSFECWQSHALFEEIHPFIDGNGRIGRCIWNVMRAECGLDLIVVKEKKKQAYYKALTNYRKNN